MVDLAAVLGDEVFAAPSLNAFLALGPDRWRQVRDDVTELLSDERHRPRVEPHLHRQQDVRLRLPFEIADCVDV